MLTVNCSRPKDEIPNASLIAKPRFQFPRRKVISSINAELAFAAPHDGYYVPSSKVVDYEIQDG